MTRSTDEDGFAPLPPPVPTPPGGEVEAVDVASLEAHFSQASGSDLVRERYERFIAVVCAQIVGLETFASRHGEAAAKRLTQTVGEQLEPMLLAAQGRVLSQLGAGGVSAYTSADAAVQAALRLQRGVRQANLRAAGPEAHVELRIGVHCGPALVNEDTGRVYGDTLDAVTRLTAKAGARQIALSESVRGHLTARYLLEPLGTLALQGQAKELALFSVAWDVADPEPQDPAPPDVDARYTLMGRLGHEDRSSVWKARDVTRDEDVAIKVLRFPEPLSAGERERLVDEIESASRLEHPNLVRVEDCAILSGVEGYVVMELVQGAETLRERIDREGPLPVHLAALIAHELAEGLGAAHASGLLHRDLRPENVLLSSSGMVKLADLGIALDDAQRRSPEGAALAGSPAYLSPEQVRGDPTLPASDVFSFGIVLYELLTGRLPFVGASPSTVMFRIVEGRYTPPEGLDAALGAVLRRCLEVDAAARFKDGTELKEALRRVLHRRGVTDPAGALATLLISGEDAERDAVLPVMGSSRSAPGFWTRSRMGLAAAAVAVLLFVGWWLLPGGASAPAPVAMDGALHITEGLDMGADPESADTSFQDELAADAEAAQADAEEAARLRAERLAEAEQRAQEEARRQEARAAAHGAEEAPREGAEHALASTGPTDDGARRRRRRPTPAAATTGPVAPRTGTVTLSVTGWADIVVNGQSYGRFPQVTSLTLPEGVHTLELLNPHREPYRKRIRVTAGKEVAHRAELIARP